MRISTEHTERLEQFLSQRVQESAQEQRRVAEVGRAREARDGVEVSDQADQARRLAELALEASEVDRTRVDRLRAQVQNGTYHPDATAIAKALLNALES